MVGQRNQSEGVGQEGRARGRTGEEGRVGWVPAGKGDGGGETERETGEE